MKKTIRVQVSEEIANRLAAAAAVARPGATKGGIVETALGRLLDPDKEIVDNAAIMRSLEAVGARLECLDRDLKIVNEIVALHARYHFAVTPQIPQSQQRAVCARGVERFEIFAAQVGERLHLGTSLIEETLDRPGHKYADQLRQEPKWTSAPRSPSPAATKAPDVETRVASSQNTERGVVPQRMDGDSHFPRDTGASSAKLQKKNSTGTKTATRRPASSPSASYNAIAKIIAENWWPILFVFLPFAAGYYLAYLFRTINALISERLATDLGLGPVDLGLLTSAYFLTFAAAQIPIGMLLDRYGPRRVQSAMLLVAAVGAVLFATAQHFGLLVLARALIGLGAAAALPAGLKAIVQWFPKERLALVNGCMVMLGGLGAVTASAPAERLMGAIGWPGVFEFFALVTAVCAVLIHVVVPDAASSPPTSNDSTWRGFKIVFRDPRFWRLAPISATCIGTAFALQGLWVTPWLTDVEGASRTVIVTQLFVMAVVQSLGAFFVGIGTDQLRRRGIPPQKLVALGTTTLIMAQVLLILRVPVPSYFIWSTVALVGGTTVLGFVILAEYFPKEIAGRANAALGIFHIGGAFVIQLAIGVIVQAWVSQNGHYPAIAYETAFLFNVGLQIAALIWFIAPQSPRVATHFKLATA